MWVIITTVCRNSALVRLISPSTSALVLLSRLPVGSSASTIAGLVIRRGQSPHAAAVRRKDCSAYFQFIFQSQQVNDLVQKLLIHRVPVQLHRQDDVLIHIQDGNKVIVLEDKADVAAAEDGELFVVHFRQLFVPDNHGSAGGSVQPAHHVKQGGLAAAGGSHNGHKLAVIYREVHAVKGAGDIRLCTVILFQVDRL